VSDDSYGPPADIEVGGSWRADSVRWQQHGRSDTETLGDVETEELREKAGLPDAPSRGHSYRDVARRWRFSTWLRDPNR
jgi:hypothetical protein